MIIVSPNDHGYPLRRSSQCQLFPRLLSSAMFVSRNSHGHPRQRIAFRSSCPPRQTWPSLVADIPMVVVVIPHNRSFSTAVISRDGLALQDVSAVDVPILDVPAAVIQPEIIPVTAVLCDGCLSRQTWSSVAAVFVAIIHCDSHPQRQLSFMPGSLRRSSPTISRDVPCSRRPRGGCSGSSRLGAS